MGTGKNGTHNFGLWDECLNTVISPESLTLQNQIGQFRSCDLIDRTIFISMSSVPSMHLALS